MDDHAAPFPSARSGTTTGPRVSRSGRGGWHFFSIILAAILGGHFEQVLATKAAYSAGVTGDHPQ